MASFTVSSSFTASPRLSCTKRTPKSNSSSVFLLGQNPISLCTKSLFVPTIKDDIDLSCSSFLGFMGNNDYDFDEDSYIGAGFGMLEGHSSSMNELIEEKELPPCPPGCRYYESNLILRPDMSEEQRIAFIQQIEEFLVAGGAMYVNASVRGINDISVTIRKPNPDGTRDKYNQGIYMCFTYFTKPESIGPLETRLNNDFDVLRQVTYKKEEVRKEDEDEDEDGEEYEDEEEYDDEYDDEYEDESEYEDSREKANAI